MNAVASRLIAVSLPIVAVSAWAAVTAVPAGAATEPCATSALTLRVERGDGDAGMSHDGALVVVRNVGTTACALSALPSLAMLGADGAVVARGVPPGARFMHPGPVVFPLELAAGQSAAARLRWIVGNVFGDAPARKVTAASLALETGGGSVTTPLTATVWGEARAPLDFTQERLTTALPPLGAPSKAAAGRFAGEGPAGSTFLDSHGQPARRLVLRAGPPGALHFSFEGLGGSAPSTGSLEGSLAVRGNGATFEDAASDCKLAIAFYAAQLTVAQTGTCGFGNGVTAAGRYREL